MEAVSRNDASVVDRARRGEARNGILDTPKPNDEVAQLIAHSLRALAAASAVIPVRNWQCRVHRVGRASNVRPRTPHPN